VTGDELLEPDADLGPGQIRDSNAYALAAQALRAGAEVVHRAVVRDDPDATVTAVEAALAAADVVCVSGGVSVGPHDHVKPALAALGVEEHFWGVALKPGKPTWFGRRKDRLVFGLPGNPVSAMITFHLFVRPALRRLAGADHEEVRSLATLDTTVPREPHREQVLRCRLHGHDGWHVEPTGAQGSHVLTSMLGAGALALVPAGAGELEAGARIEIEILF
jgi:molybdopterin molybdotransferase